MRWGELLRRIEELWPLGDAASWDSVGLLLGSRDDEVHRLLVALDVRSAVVAEAVERGADGIITHHPLLFRPLARLDTGSHPARLLVECARQKINLCALHTNLDVAPEGPTAWVARCLGLAETRILEDPPPRAERGFGLIGRLPRRREAAEFARHVAEVLAVPTTRWVAGSRAVERVAVVSGSGSSFLATAAGAGADALVTGDVGYHAAVEAEELGITLVDAGHWGTEKEAARILATELTRLTDGELPVMISQRESDPFREV